MAIKILNKSEKAEIEKKMHEQFGIKEIKEKIISIGKEKLFLFSGNITGEEIKKLSENTKIERMGIYFAKIEEKTKEIRLSIDGAQLLGNEVKRNVVELQDEKDVEEWMQGKELNIETGKRGFVVIKHGEDFLGSGKASENKITNFIPKNRRLKEKN